MGLGGLWSQLKRLDSEWTRIFNVVGRTKLTLQRICVPPCLPPPIPIPNSSTITTINQNKSQKRNDKKTKWENT
ncbi:hypothetical protein QQP08_014945 [Theobroma cacao]|nr:hypothetical protein QQP08_013157 [Theobroma cacao]WRX22458.1 hypothetical protein QQP08_014945 [Theobroma cacao]